MADRPRQDRPSTRPRFRVGLSHVAVALACCVAFAGTATAAKLITGKQVRNNSLTGKDVKDRSLTERDLKKGSFAAAPAGVAYAKVTHRVVEGESTYTLDEQRSKNIQEVNRTGNPNVPAIPGLVCLNVTVPVNVAVASAERLPVERSVIATVQMPTINGADRCPPGTDALVSLKNTGDEPTESSFFVIFN